jgi:hypothetical protein
MHRVTDDSVRSVDMRIWILGPVQKDDSTFDAIKAGCPGATMPGFGQLGLSDEEMWRLVGSICCQLGAGTVEKHIKSYTQF